jgi:hypothetical protein
VSGVDLVQWLTACLDEDERIARRAGDSFRQIGETGVIVATEGDRAEECASANWAGVAEHIVRHDPARVLREIDAKRQMLDAYLPPGADPHPGLPCINYEGARPEDFDEYDSCSRHLEANKRRFHGDYVLRLLALPYADRPGYLESWRP